LVQEEREAAPETARPPLAWGQHGDPVELPKEAVGWRVRRHKIGDRGGAPELIYENGRPLILELEATAEELVDRVGGKTGRYRLDRVDQHGRPVKAAPAYAVIERPIEAVPKQETGFIEPVARLLAAVEQLVKTQNEGMACLATQFSASMNAASGLLLPPDKRRPIEIVTQAAAAAESAGFDWNTFMQAIAPALQGALTMLAQKAMSGNGEPGGGT